MTIQMGNGTIIKTELHVSIFDDESENVILIRLYYESDYLLIHQYHMTEEEIGQINDLVCERYWDDLSAAVFKTKNITGTNLRLARKRAELSLWKASKKSFVPIWKLIKIEYGRADVYTELENNVRIAEVLPVSINALERLLMAYEIFQKFYPLLSSKYFFFTTPQITYSHSPRLPLRIACASTAILELTTYAWAAVSFGSMGILQHFPQVTDYIPFGFFLIPQAICGTALFVRSIVGRLERKSYEGKGQFRLDINHALKGGGVAISREFFVKKGLRFNVRIRFAEKEDYIPGIQIIAWKRKPVSKTYIEDEEQWEQFDEIAFAPLAERQGDDNIDILFELSKRFSKKGMVEFYLANGGKPLPAK